MSGSLIALKKERRDRLSHLRKQREEIVSLSSEKALERILEDKHPAALVHSFPEEDFYFLLQDIGIDDALPLIALSSNRQREYLLDVDGWHRDRQDPHAVTRWLNAMLLSDPDRTVSWLLQEQTELIELLLFRNVQVVLREHDEDPSDFGDGFNTYDDVYYFRILEDPTLSFQENMPEQSDGKMPDELRQDFFSRFLAKLADMDHLSFQKMLMESAVVLPAEMEEELYRLRNVRLAEKGFLPPEEAIGVYQPVTPSDLKLGKTKVFGQTKTTEAEPLPLYPVSMLRKKTPFTDALSEIDSGALLERIQLEFVTLCNQVISADQQKIQAKVALQSVVEKVSGYLNIGLEAWAAEDSSASNRKAAAFTSLVQQVPLTTIFRLGYGRALALKWEAQKWRKSAWFQAAKLPLTFWGEKWLGVLGGLLIDKPLFFDNYQTGASLYREFKTLQDVTDTEQALSAVIGMDALFSGMTAPCRTDAGSLLTWQNLLLTLWARHHLNISAPEDSDPQARLKPLTLNEFKSFYLQLFAQNKEVFSSGKTITSMKADFLSWLSTKAGKAPQEITAMFGPVLDDLFDQVDAELGSMQPDTDVLRFIHLFRVA